MIAKEGSGFEISKLYRGLSANFLGSTVSWSLYFVLYERIKSQWVLSSGQGQISAWQYFCFSSAAGSTLVCLTNPIWLVKTRLCANNTPGTPGYYRGMLDAFKSIYATEGIRGFYKGFLAGIIGSSHGAIQFMFYEKMKEAYKRHYSSHSNNDSPVILAFNKIRTYKVIFTCILVRIL